MKQFIHKYVFQPFLAWVFLGLVIAGLALPTAYAATSIASASPTETAPVCEHVTVQENSGNDPNYKIKLCGATALPVRTIVIDGSALPEKTETTWQPVALWTKQVTP